MVSIKNQINFNFRGFGTCTKTARILLVMFGMGLGAACSINDDLGTTLAVPAEFPKFSDMPEEKATGLTPAEVTALRLQLDDLAATHEEARTEKIVER